MQINLQSKNIEVTPEIENYVLKRVTNLEKLLANIEERGGEVNVNFEVSRSTNHHKLGNVFNASCKVITSLDNFYSSVDGEDLLQAVDEVKENLFREISKKSDRRRTLFKRGAASVKKMMKGLSKRNPFTSKY